MLCTFVCWLIKIRFISVDNLISVKILQELEKKIPEWLYHAYDELAFPARSAEWETHDDMGGKKWISAKWHIHPSISSIASLRYFFRYNFAISQTEFPSPSSSNM